MSDTNLAPAPAPGAPAAAPPIDPASTPTPAPAPAVTPASSPGTLAAPPPTPAAPAAQPTPPPAAIGTLAAPGDTPPVTITTNFPDNWRERMASEIAPNDPAYLERLKRFASPAALARSYRELESRVSSGQLKAPPAPPPDNATPEQMTAWRSENNLPTTAQAFVDGLQLPDGVVPGEADKPLLASFAEAAVQLPGWTQAHYNQAISWYYGLQDKLVAERQAADDDMWTETQTELIREWGPAFKAKQNNFNNWLAKTFPEDLVGPILNARLPDGSKMFGNAGVLKAIMDQWEQINPVQSALPNVPGATLANADQRITEIEQKYMRAAQNTPEWRAYWQNSSMQEELRSLYAAREAMQARQGGRAA